MKLTNEEIKKIVFRSEHESERIKDMVHDLYDEKQELYERIYDLKDKLYKEEDRNDSILQFLIHSNITFGEMIEIGKLLND